MKMAEDRYKNHILYNRQRDTQSYRTLHTPQDVNSNSGRGKVSSSSSMAGRSNSGSQYKDKPFRPTISEASQQISKKSRSGSKGKKVYEVLYAENVQLAQKKEKAEKEVWRKQKKEARQSFINNLSENSDQHLMTKFREEFDKVIEDQLSQGPQLYLLDIMEDLKFLDQDKVGKEYAEIEKILQKYKLSLIIDIEKHEIHDRGLTDIKNNLFKICCAIMHFRMGKPKDEIRLEDMIVKSYLSNIDLRLANPHVILIDRLTCIKNLANRAEFDLSERQTT